MLRRNFLGILSGLPFIPAKFVFGNSFNYPVNFIESEEHFDLVKVNFEEEFVLCPSYKACSYNKIITDVLAIQKQLLIYYEANANMEIYVFYKKIDDHYIVSIIGCDKIKDYKFKKGKISYV